MNLNKGDVVINRHTNRKYIVQGKNVNGVYIMASTKTGREYPLTDFDKYIIETKGTDNCNHEWRTYNSGWTIYDYCEKCPAKRENT